MLTIVLFVCAGVVLTITLGVAGVMDWQDRFIPPKTWWPFWIVGLPAGFMVWVSFWQQGHGYCLAVSAAVMAWVYWMAKRRSKKMGGADAMAYLAVGWVMPFFGLLAVLLISVVLPKLCRKFLPGITTDWKDRGIPFVVFVAAGWIAVVPFCQVFTHLF